MNHFKTYMLLAGLTALFMAAGFLIGGAAGMMIALVFALAMNAFSYWNADKIVLRTYGAVEVDESHPEPLIRNYVIDTVEMARSAGLPRPRITVIDSAQPNAFATGRDPDHAAVAASTGLLQLLTREEIRGVMAHELAHVKNRDTLVMTVTATIAGAISALANFAFFFSGSRDDEGNGGGLGGMIGAILIAILAPIAAMLVQMAISRAREYEADRIGAQIAGDSESLARALQKIEAYARGGYENVQAERNPATAHMFIINPLAGKGADNLFSTHPATHNRVEALMRLGVERGARRPAAVPASSSVPLSGGSHEAGPWG